MSKFSTDVISGKVNVTPKTEVYNDAGEKYLNKVVLYAKDTSDGFIYADATCTANVSHDDLLNLCMKGLVVVLYKSVYHNPVYFKDATGTVTVTIATKISASDSAVLELKSKEPVEG